MRQQRTDPAAITAEIAYLRSLALDALRRRWRGVFGRPPPAALSKDLLGRMIAWRMQEQAFGGLDRDSLRFLEGLARHGGSPRRHLKPGTVLCRDYQGHRHTVTIVSDGFNWQGTTYASLSAIARAITGTPWSGPRFFALARPKGTPPARRHKRNGPQTRALELDDELPARGVRFRENGRVRDSRHDNLPAAEGPSTRPSLVRHGDLGPMNGPLGKLARCAIYTRKSTEYNLELAFNSLDAQREACEAYIKSQAPEGWRLIPGRYDDGAFSGASLDRPALQQLLADVGASKIDIVLVYKVDRLTRSLADFAKLIELFDAHDVSFVSVTQSFNTSSSMGRLTLNVLLSFAQFERELIGERVRDKIAASKRKGIWVGGPVPLGYAAVDKKIVVVPAEAAAVRTIFARYLELGSLRVLADDLTRRGFRSKSRKLSNGRRIGGGPFGVGALAYLLKNRFYIGEVIYRGQIYSGGHAPILDRDLFEAAQARLAAQALQRRCRLRGSPALLTGRIFDERGNRMSPSHTNKGGARYRYYVSQSVLQRKSQPPGSVSRIAAAEIEALVITALRKHLQANPTEAQPTPDNERELVEHYVERLTLGPKHIKLQLRQSIDALEARNAPDDRSHSPAIPIASGTITIPWTRAVPAAVKGIIHVPAHNTPMKPSRREALLTAIAKARKWIDDLMYGHATSLAAIARREGMVERHVRLLLQLAFVSPRIVSALLDGTAPADPTVTTLARGLPYSWAEQERRVGTQSHATTPASPP